MRSHLYAVDKVDNVRGIPVDAIAMRGAQIGPEIRIGRCGAIVGSCQESGAALIARAKDGPWRGIEIRAEANVLTGVSPKGGNKFQRVARTVVGIGARQGAIDCQHTATDRGAATRSPWRAKPACR